jgi:hypothetical protein
MEWRKGKGVFVLAGGLVQESSEQGRGGGIISDRPRLCYRAAALVILGLLNNAQ